MPEYVTAAISYGLELQVRVDMFGEEHEDAIVRFGKQYRGRWLGETNRHWLSWLYAVREDSWPADLLALVWKWGEAKSEGKDAAFEELVEKQRANRERRWAE